MRKFLVLLCLAILVLFPPLKAQAQEPVRFSEVEVSLWPEYDRPTVLVIYRITLSADTTLPVNLSVQIPGLGWRTLCCCPQTAQWSAL